MRLMIAMKQAWTEPLEDEELAEGGESYAEASSPDNYQEENQREMASG